MINLTNMQYQMKQNFEIPLQPTQFFGFQVNSINILKGNYFKMRLTKVSLLIFIIIASFFTNPVFSQVSDTIANWDGTNVEWSFSGPTGEDVENPEQQSINPSSNCLKIITSDNPYDLIYTDFTNAVDFNQFPVFHLKILAPESGGSVLLKFEDSDNSSWVEIEKTPVPGQWDDLEFDFSGTTATDYSRMVIFFDFLGTEDNNQWYLDDVLRISDGTTGLTSNLPIVIINTNGVEIPDEPKITGIMGIIDNGPGNMNNQYDPPNNYDGYIGIEIRGQSSQMFPKKSYGVETRYADGENLDVPLLGMPEENDWVLYAPFSDKSMLRNFVTFFMGSHLDPYCSRMAYCEVIVNSEYKGVYILMEKIKKNENRVDIAKLKEDDISGNELTGGYIVKVDKIDPGFVFGTDGWRSIPTPPYPDAMNIIFQFYYPKAEDIVQQQKNYIQDYIATSENSLTKTTFVDRNEGYNKYLNTPSFVDQLILNEIAKEVDNYRYSTYFFKEKDSDGGKLHAGPAWDFNLGYSNVDFWPPGNDYTGWMYPMVEPVEWGIMFWWKRLMEDPYFRDLFYTRWHQLREYELSNENLQTAIDSIVNYIDEAKDRNYERWPILGEYVWPNYDWEGNDYEDEVTYFENWLFNRIDWIDDNITGNLLHPSAELSKFFPDLEITLTDDYFNKPVLENEYFLLNNAPTGMKVESVNYINASQARVSLSGNTDDANEVSVTIKDVVLNSYEDITTNELSLDAIFIPFENPTVVLYSTPNTLHLKCSNPKLLGNKLEVFNPSGQLIKTASIEQQQINSIEINGISGIYFCRYQVNSRTQTQKVIVIR